MTTRRCGVELCGAPEHLLAEPTSYFHCLAMAGEATFDKCQDGCLARALLAELGHPAATLAELQQKILLLKSIRP